MLRWPIIFTRCAFVKKHFLSIYFRFDMPPNIVLGNCFVNDAFS